MKKSSIYPNRSQELLTLFEKAGNPSKLMCVPSITPKRIIWSCSVTETARSPQAIFGQEFR
jgi:hypothetical protein